MTVLEINFFNFKFQTNPMQTLKAFVPTTNPAKAKSFYRDTLGLALKSEDSFALEFDDHGTPLRITTVQTFTPHPFTVLGWDVTDITKSIKSLREKGVTFEIYKGLQQDELGIWTAPSGTKVAWFKDPDGNTL